MKKLLLLSLVFLYAGSYGQVIPNYDFESWSNGPNNAPNGWEDRGSNHAGFYPASQSTDKYLGNYSVKIENKLTSTDTTKGSIATLRPGGQQGFGPAFAVGTRYNNLKGFYKYMPQNGDSGQIIVYITKTGFVNGQGWGNLLAWGQKHLGAASVWTPFSVGYLDSLSNFYYFDNTAVPDSAYLEICAYKMIGTTGGDLPAFGNSALYVDALNFDTYLSGVNEHMNITKGFALFPSVTSGKFNVEFETETSEFTSLKLYDLNGQLVKFLYGGPLTAGKHIMNYDASELTNGTYLFVLATESGYKANKLIISK